MPKMSNENGETMKEMISAISWDICSGCGGKYIRIDSNTCLNCHRENPEK